MLYNSNLKYSYASITPVYVEKVTRQQDGAPGQPRRSVKVTREIICTNSSSFSSKLKEFNPDQLEIDLSTKKRLEKVDSRVLSQDSIDFCDFPLETPSAETTTETEIKTE